MSKTPIAASNPILSPNRGSVLAHTLDCHAASRTVIHPSPLLDGTTLSTFSDAVHAVLRNLMENRPILDDPDLVLSCQTRRQMAPLSPHILHGKQTLLTFYPNDDLPFRALFTDSSWEADPKAMACQPAQSRQDRDCYRRAGTR